MEKLIKYIEDQFKTLKKENELDRKKFKEIFDSEFSCLENKFDEFHKETLSCLDGMNKK